MKRVDFHGIECVEIANDRLSLLASISVGPRILRCGTPAGENLFAELPGVTLECPGAGDFHFYGGHRLWAAPEDPPATYLPDDRAVCVEELEDGVRLTDDPHERSPLRKTLEIRLTPGSARAVVRHTLTNQGPTPLRHAPWAITQLAPGGVAILPQRGPEPGRQHGTERGPQRGPQAGPPCGNGPLDNSVLPDRRLALWPYTDLGSEAIRWRGDAILIHAGLRHGKLKLGYPNPAGWLGYWREETLFVKRAEYHPGADYFDLGSSSECYCDPRFLELETLGPAADLEPGCSTEHTEVWSVHEGVRWTDDLAAIYAAVDG